MRGADCRHAWGIRRALLVVVLCVCLTGSQCQKPPGDDEDLRLGISRARGLHEVSNSETGVLLDVQAKFSTASGKSKAPGKGGSKSISVPSVSAECPRPPTGYYLRDSVSPNSEAHVLQTVEPGTTLWQLAQKCRQTPFCVAVDTKGNLYTGVTNNTLNQAPSTTPCYGIYLQRAPRKWVGLASSFDPHLKAARENGEAVVQQQKLFLDQVDVVRELLKNVDPSKVDQSSTLDLVTHALGLETPELRSRRLLQGGDESVAFTDVQETAAKLVAAAAAPAVYDPRDPVSTPNTGGVFYPCPVMQQGDCGSCQAFTAVGAAEMAVAFFRNQTCPVRLSQQWTFFCNGLFKPTCDEGWVPTEASKVLNFLGVPYQSCFPYTGTQGCNNLCAPNTPKPPGRFATHTFGPDGLAAAKAFIRTQGAIFSYLDAFSDLMSYKGGVYEHIGGRYEGGHSLLVVGYDDLRRAWICRNSWGSDWGEGGYVLFSYNDPIFMKGDYFNIVGVSYMETSADGNTNGPLNIPPFSDFDNVPPPPPVQPQNAPNMMCSVALYSDAAWSGQSIRMSWPRGLTAAERGCAYLEDLDKTSPSFAYKTVGYILKCSCSGTSSKEECYGLGQRVKFYAWRQSFQYFRDNTIASPERGSMYFLKSDCTSSDCTYAVSQLSKGNVTKPGWYQAINSAALCWQIDDFGPWS